MEIVKRLGLSMILPLVGFLSILFFYFVDSDSHHRTTFYVGSAIALTACILCAYAVWLDSDEPPYREAIAVERIAGGVRILAEPPRCTLLGSVILPAASALGITGAFVILLNNPRPMSSAEIIDGAILVGVPVLVLAVISARRYWWYRQRFTHPGHIDLTPQGITQQVGPHIKTTTWDNIGEPVTSGGLTRDHEVVNVWRTHTPDGEPAGLRLLLSPLSTNMYGWNTLFKTLANNPEQAALLTTAYGVPLVEQALNTKPRFPLPPSRTGKEIYEWFPMGYPRRSIRELKETSPVR